MTRLLSSALLLLVPGALLAQAPAPPGVFDVIPRDASAALVLRSIGDFKTKGKQIIADLDLKVAETPAQMVEMLADALHITGGIDEKAPVVLTILLGKGRAAAGPEELVLMVPFNDRDKILAGFKLDKKPKDGEVVKLTGWGFFSPTALAVRGRYLCLALSEKALERLTNDSLAVSAEEKKQFGDADLLLYLGKRAWPVLWGDYLSSLETYFTVRKDGVEKMVGEQFVKALRATERSFVSARYHEGLRLQSNMVLDVEKEKAAREMLEMLKAGTARASVKGLPDGKVIAALGWAGDGSKNGILTKLIFDVFLEGPLPGALNSLPIFASTDYPTVAAVTHQLWQRLRAARVGLYHNQKEELGLFSAVAVLDAADATAFIKEVRTLARIGRLKAEDLKSAEGKELVDVEKLVRDLDADEYEVRESASARLLILGEPALPALQKAIDKKASLEQVRRAERLKANIEKGRELRRKEALLPKDAPRAVRPTFVFSPAVEKREGVSVDVLAIELEGKNPAFVKQMEGLFGPGWSKMRVAVVGNQVAVLLGSDVGLLDRTLANLKGGKGGLAEGKLLAGFQKRAQKGRTAEMHGSAQGFLGLLGWEGKLPAKMFRDPPQLTSFAVALKKDRIEMDLFVPVPELRVMVKAVTGVRGLVTRMPPSPSRKPGRPSR